MVPKKEMYGSPTQTQRVCIFLPAKIAGGCGGGGELELPRFL